MLENVRGLGSTKFAAYRESIMLALSRQNYAVGWRLLNACDYGVPQLRPRFILVAIKRPFDSGYRWPTPVGQRVTVGEAIGSLMGSNGWTGAEGWALRACDIAPTIVGGSKKHGGPDLGPSRAREKWLRLGVDGRGVANTPPSADFPMDGIPRLTVEMVARIQGFPEEWRFTGKKTAAYRQVGNAFPPPVSREVANAIKAALTGKASKAEACGGQTELFSLG
jgi:DNA (cytosine-5)-methyltransferase 1